MERIDHPKVFISYAWGSNEYQMKVLTFATSLSNDGVEVLLDKWEISAGNDMNNFMEKSVTDPTVTNVLILLDKNYAEKANSKIGGVGTETQIISQQVYASVEQTKFIPVVFERDLDGTVYKPVYLQSRYHYDLSREETYDTEYKNLVRALFGVEAYKKPETGVRPAWVDEQISVSPKTIIAYDSLKENRPENVKEDLLFSYFEDIEQKIVEYSSRTYEPKISLEEYLKAYEANRDMRKEFLLLIQRSAYCENRMAIIGDFFEKVHNLLEENSSVGYELSKVFLHELFLYTVAILLKRKNYKDIGYILGRTYFSARPTLERTKGHSYTLFYSGSYHTNLDNAMKNKDGQNYYSGTAHYWISTIDVDFCTKEELVSADLLCYNYSIYGNGFIGNWQWFPITYIYVNEYTNYIARLSRALISKEKVNKVIQMFNYDTKEEFIKKVADVEEAISEGKYRDYRYNMAFESAPILGTTIKAEEIASVR